jgi:hypothetical protein
MSGVNFFHVGNQFNGVALWVPKSNESSKARLHSTLWSRIDPNAMFTKDLHRAIEFFVVNDLKRDMMKPRLSADQFEGVRAA